jgi:hypothetical protein
MADKKGLGHHRARVVGRTRRGRLHPSPSDVPPDQSAPPPQPSTFFVSPLPASPSGQVTSDQVFEAAGILVEERDRVTKARDLLAALAARTGPALKKQIVEAWLEAFGARSTGSRHGCAHRDGGSASVREEPFIRAAFGCFPSRDEELL